MDNNAHITVDIGGMLAADQSDNGPTGVIYDELQAIMGMEGNQQSFEINSATTGTIPLTASGDYPTDPYTLGGTVSDPVIVAYSGNVASLGCDPTAKGCTVVAVGANNVIVAAITVYSNASVGGSAPYWSAGYYAFAPAAAHEVDGHSIMALGDTSGGDATTSIMGPYSDNSPSEPTECDKIAAFNKTDGAYGCDPSCDPTSPDFCTCNPNDDACSDLCDTDSCSSETCAGYNQYDCGGECISNQDCLDANSGDTCIAGSCVDCAGDPCNSESCQDFSTWICEGFCSSDSDCDGASCIDGACVDCSDSCNNEGCSGYDYCQCEEPENSCCEDPPPW